MGDDIKILLFEQAQALFRQKGYKKTSVADITTATGISIGSFYRYYPSKERLFLEVFSAVNLRAEQGIVAELDQQPDLDLPEYARQLVRRLIDALRADPILQTWYDRGTWHKIIAKGEGANLVPGEEQTSRTLFSRIIQTWKSRGRIRPDLDDALIIALFDAVAIVDLYAEEIGAHLFPKIIDTLVDFIVEGLKPRPSRVSAAGCLS